MLRKKDKNVEQDAKVINGLVGEHLRYNGLIYNSSIIICFLIKIG